MAFGGLLDTLASVRAETLKAAGSGQGRDAAPNPSAAGFLPIGGAPHQPYAGATWDHKRADQEGFKACSWVYACIERLAGSCSQVPWRVMRRKARSGPGSRTGEWELTEDDPRALAIEYPNAVMSRQFLVHGAVQNLGIGGNGLWRAIHVTRKGRPVPSEFWPISPAVYRPIPVQEGQTLPPSRPGLPARTWIEGWRRLDRPFVAPLSPESVVHFQLPDPDNFLWGLSPMRAVARSIDMDVEHVRWNASLPKNRMMSETAIVDRNIKTDVQLQEALDKLQQRYAGPRAAGTPLLLADGTDVLRMGLTPVEMAWIESRRFTLIEICAAFGLSSAMFMPDSKYANLQESVRYMWENGATRFLSILEDALNTSLVPIEERASLWIHYDLSGVEAMKDSLEKRLEAHERAVRSAIPPNASFVMLDLPVDAVKNGDVPLVAGTLVTLESLTEEAPDEDTTDIEGPLMGTRPAAPGSGAGSVDAESEDPAAEDAADSSLN